MNLTDNFTLQELVHPAIYNHPSIGERCANWLSPYLAPTLQDIKNNTKDIITVNNWSFGGKRVNSGLRLPANFPPIKEVLDITESDLSPSAKYDKLIKIFMGIGAYLSGHKFGGSADMIAKYLSASQLYNHILDNQDKYPHIVRMEHISITPDWVHIDVGEARKPEEEIYIFNP